MQAMCKISPIILILFFCFFIPNPSTYAENTSSAVFQIYTDQGNSQTGTTQTGFIIQGTKGIITALHGVAGATRINARLGSPYNIYYRNLRIIRADIKRDVALLYSDELSRSELTGIMLADAYPESGEKLYITAYPLGIRDQLNSELTVRKIPIRPLKTLIPPELNPGLSKRQSPASDIKVLSLAGHLTHGDSGAPILNSKNQLVGIANGGLSSGSGEIVWAIPWHDIKWQNVSELQQELRRLASLEQALFFSNDINNDPNNDLNNQAKKILRLKIAFNGKGQSFEVSPKNTVHKTIYADRAAQYLLPLPHSLKQRELTEIFILNSEDNSIFAHGHASQTLLSSDKTFEFKFQIEKQEGIIILSANPTTYYKAKIMLPDFMQGAEIFIDDKPAQILDRKLLFVTIKLRKKDTGHNFLIKKGNNCCYHIQSISKNNEIICPCSSTSSCN